MQLLFLASMGLYAGWLLVGYEYHFLDGVNLLFHEAGHLFFGLLGRTIGMLGGTLGQFVFPIACAVHFFTRERLFEVGVCVLWLGESLLYAAIYIDDAFTMVMPLVGGEIHDWNWLLTRWGLVQSCETIALVVHGLGCLVILSGVGLSAWAWWGQRGMASQGPLLDA